MRWLPALLLLLCSRLVRPTTIHTLIGGADEAAGLLPAAVPATGALTAVLADGAGTGVYYAACGGAVVRYVALAGLTSRLVAGACLPPPGPARPLGDGGAATAALVRGCSALAANASGLFVGESEGALRFVSAASGAIATLGAAVPAGDTLRALAWAPLGSRFHGALLAAGWCSIHAFFPQNGSRVLFAGTGTCPTGAATYSNGAPAAATLLSAAALAAAPPNSAWPGGVVYADSALGVVRVVLANASVVTIAGAVPNNAPGCCPGNSPTPGTPALGLWFLHAVQSLAFTPSGFLLLPFKYWSAGTLLVNTSLPHANATAYAGAPAKGGNQQAAVRLNGRPGWTAALHALFNIQRITVDAASGTLFTYDDQNVLVAYLPNGTNQVLAGGGSYPGLVAHGTPGAALHLNAPQALAVDANTGAVLVGDTGSLTVRVFTSAGAANTATPTWGGVNSPTLVSTAPGSTPWWPFFGDGGAASEAYLGPVSALAPDGSGGYFLAARTLPPHSPTHNVTRIARVFANGTLATVAARGGNGLPCHGNGGSALAAGFAAPSGLARLASGALLVAESAAHVVRLLDASLSTVAVFAGVCNTPGSAGDGGPATAALLLAPLAVAVALDGASAYIAEGSRVRHVSGATGLISTVAGVGGGVVGSAAALLAAAPGALLLPAATAVPMNLTAGLAVDACGALFVAETGSHAVWKLFANGSLALVAGSPGRAGVSGDGGPPSAALLHAPVGLAVLQATGQLLIADSRSSRVRAVSPPPSGGAASGPLPCSPPSPSASPSPTPSPSPSPSPYAPGSAAIQTFAGGAADAALANPGLLALPSSLSFLRAIASDGEGGVLLLAQGPGDCVRRLVPGSPGAVALVAGNCHTASASATFGSGLPAANPLLSRLNGAAALAVNSSGVFIGENNRVRFVSRASGLIFTVAGTGSACAPATLDPTANGTFLSAQSVCIGAVAALAWQPQDGTLLIADASAFALRKYFPGNGSLTTLAGGQGAPPSAAASGAGQRALFTAVHPTALTVQPGTNAVFYFDSTLNCIRRIAANGSIAHVAGVPGSTGSSGNALPAATTPLGLGAHSLTWDWGGSNLVFTERNCNIPCRVRTVSSATGLLATLVQGPNAAIFSDAWGALRATATLPLSGNTIAAAYDAPSNCILVSDPTNARVWALQAGGQATVLAGPGALAAALPPATPARSLQLYEPTSLSADPYSGQLRIVHGARSQVLSVATATGLALPALSGGTGNNRIFTGSIPGPFSRATFTQVNGLAADGTGGFFASVSSSAYNETFILRVSAAGASSIWAGAARVAGAVTNSVAVGFVCHNNGPQLLAGFYLPLGLAYDVARGVLYIAEGGSSVVRNISGGLVGVFAGRCGSGAASTGDGGQALSATLHNPTTLALSPDGGTLYIGESLGQRVRAVNVSSGLIRTVLGTGAAGFSGDGGPGASAAISLPAGSTSVHGLAVDACGALFLADTGNARVRKLLPNGTVVTAVGTGAQGVWPGGIGDGGPARAAALNAPTGLAIDADGVLYIAEGTYGRVRSVASGEAAACAPPSRSPSHTPSPSLSPSATPAPGPVIHTLAGLASDSGVPAWVPALQYVAGLALDGWGTGWLAAVGSCVRRFWHNGSTSLLAGNCKYTSSGSAGDGAVALGNAASGATLWAPRAMAANATGFFVLEIARLRYVSSASGVISTVAGGRAGGCAGDALAGGLTLPAASVCFSANPTALAWAAAGPGGLGQPPAPSTPLLIADAGLFVIRAFAPGSALLWTLAGAGTPPNASCSGNGMPWLAAPLAPRALAASPATGELHFVDAILHTVRRLAANGSVAHVAGVSLGSWSSPDGAVAATSALCSPAGIAFDGAARLLIAESCYTGRVRVVSAAGGGLLGTLAGGVNTLPTLGEMLGPTPAAAQALVQTNAVLHDPVLGAALVSDTNNNRVKACFYANASCVTVAGPGSHPALAVGRPANALQLQAGAQNSLAWEPTTGSLIVTDKWYVRAFAVSGGGAVQPALLTSSEVWAGQGGATWGWAVDAQRRSNTSNLAEPRGPAADGAGGVLFVTSSGAYNYTRVARLSMGSRSLAAVAGMGAGGNGAGGAMFTCLGNGGPATSAGFASPTAVAVNASSGALYVAEGHVVRRVDAQSGLISTYAGQCGVAGSSGDGGVATAALLNAPLALAVDPVQLHLHVADSSGRVRRVNASTGVILTVAGTGSNTYNGASGVGSSVSLSRPCAMAFDACGSLFICDCWSNAVRKLAPSGMLTTLTFATSSYPLPAPWPGTSGDGASAALAQIASPSGIAVDGFGNIYVFDSVNALIRVITPYQSVAACSPSPSPSPSGTQSQTPTQSPTPTPTPSATQSSSASGTCSPTGSGTPTPSSSPSATATATGPASPTPSPTAPPSASPAASGPPTLSPTAAATPSATPTLAASPTATPTAGASVTSTGSQSLSGTGTPSGSATQSLTPSGSPSASAAQAAAPTGSATGNASAVASGGASACASASALAGGSAPGNASATAPPASSSASAEATGPAAGSAAVSLTPPANATASQLAPVASGNATALTPTAATTSQAAAASATAEASANAPASGNATALASGNATAAASVAPPASSGATAAPLASANASAAPSPTAPPVSGNATAAASVAPPGSSVGTSGASAAPSGNATTAASAQGSANATAAATFALSASGNVTAAATPALTANASALSSGNATAAASALASAPSAAAAASPSGNASAAAASACASATVAGNASAASTQGSGHSAAASAASAASARPCASATAAGEPSAVLSPGGSASLAPALSSAPCSSATGSGAAAGASAAQTAAASAGGSGLGSAASSLGGTLAAGASASGSAATLAASLAAGASASAASSSTVASGSPTGTPTASLTRGSSASTTSTPSLTASPTATPTASLTLGASASLSSSGTLTASPTPTPTAALSQGASASASSTETLTASPSPTPTASLSLCASASATSSATLSASPTPTPSASLSVGASPSGTPTATLSASPTASPSPTLSLGASPSATSSATPASSPAAFPSASLTSVGASSSAAAASPGSRAPAPGATASSASGSGGLQAAGAAAAQSSAAQQVMPGGTTGFVAGLAGAVLLGMGGAALLLLRQRQQRSASRLALTRSARQGGQGAKRLGLVENPLLRKQQQRAQPPRPPQGRPPAHAFRSFHQVHGGGGAGAGAGAAGGGRR